MIENLMKIFVVLFINSMLLSLKILWILFCLSASIVCFIGAQFMGVVTK